MLSVVCFCVRTAPWRCRALRGPRPVCLWVHRPLFTVNKCALLLEERPDLGPWMGMPAPHVPVLSSVRVSCKDLRVWTKAAAGCLHAENLVLGGGERGNSITILITLLFSTPAIQESGVDVCLPPNV